MIMGAYMHEGQHQTPATLHALGMTVAETDCPAGGRSGVEAASVVIVMMVGHGSAAHHMGVEAGDIISEVDGRSIRTLRDLEDALADHAASTPIRLLFQVGGPGGGMWRFSTFPFR